MPSAPVLLCRGKQTTTVLVCAMTHVGSAPITVLLRSSTDAQQRCSGTLACLLHLCCSVEASRQAAHHQANLKLVPCFKTACAYL